MGTVKPSSRRVSATREAVLKVPLFLFGFLLVRGLPALLLYRGQLPARDRVGMALLSATQLPLVVAITSLGVAQGQMRQSTAVALVTAGVLSVLLFPTLAIAIRRSGEEQPQPALEDAVEGALPVEAGLEPAGL